VLDQHVLISTSSPDQRDVPLARFPHDLMRRLWLAIWTAGPNNYGRPGVGQPGRVTNLVSGYDTDIDGNPSILRRMSQRGEGRAVVPVIGRQIYQHRNCDGAHR
jgi:hypothetical protein